MYAVVIVFIVCYSILSLGWLEVCRRFEAGQKLPGMTKAFLLVVVVFSVTAVLSVGVFFAVRTPMLGSWRYLSFPLLTWGGFALAVSRVGEVVFDGRRLFGRPVATLMTRAGIAATALGFAAFGMTLIR